MSPSRSRSRTTLIVLLATFGCGGKTLGATGGHAGDAGDEVCSMPQLTPAELLHPSCPVSPPEIGDDCEPVNLVCAYERCLASGQSDVIFVCLASGGFFFENRWECGPNAAECPECLPVEGEPCGEMACRAAMVPARRRGAAPTGGGSGGSTAFRFHDRSRAAPNPLSATSQGTCDLELGDRGRARRGLGKSREGDDISCALEALSPGQG
jgi:hypothetical protein